jgi:DNA-binding NarL/FixJ family response regulator
MTKEMIKVILADDHPLIREGIRNRLQREIDIEIVGEASTGVEALEKTRTLKPDVLVLDMELPEMSGLEVAQALSKLKTGTKILGLSGYDNDQYVVKLLELGAAGYLTKEENVDRIVEAIRGIASGETGWLSRRAASALIRKSAAQQEAVPNVALLSRREREVLLLLAEGMSNSQMAERLFVVPSTVKKHLTNIYEKLHLTSRAEAVWWTWKNGLKQG